MKKILFILSIFLLTGCYNYRELETLGVASSVLIDYTDQYEVKIEISKGEDETNVFEGKGTSISKALEDAVLGTQKELSYNHLNALILTKNVNIKETILFFLRDPDINNTFYIALTEDTKIYEGEENIGELVYEILNRNNARTFFELSKIFFNKNVDIVLPIINEDLHITSIMAYDDLEAKKEFDLSSMEINTILNSKDGSYLKTSCDNDFFVFKTNEVDTDIKIGKNIKIDIDIEASVIEYNCKYNLMEEKGIKEIEKLANEKLKKDVEMFLDDIKEYNTDIYGIDQMINNKYHNLKKNWREFNYEINISTHINKKGLLLP